MVFLGYPVFYAACDCGRTSGDSKEKTPADAIIGRAFS
jgi:hypothetical protein